MKGPLSRWCLRLCVFVLLGAAASRGRAAEDLPRALSPFVLILGVAQDGGYPQAGCRQKCCSAAWKDPARRRHVAAAAIVDPVSRERWLIDATPDFRDQLHALDDVSPPESGPGLQGILLTHGHIGHYTGLMFLGREVMGARGIPVYVMPRMKEFLEGSGPWDQLVRLKNIDLRAMRENVSVPLNDRIRVTPVPVPHRDEYTETVGFRIEGPRRSVLYIPDIDKWDKWDKWEMPLEEALAGVDVAYLDGTFYAGGELPGRDMAEIPHPFIIETMERLSALPDPERRKVRFIHLNHTNPALNPGSEAARAIRKAGFRLAREGEKLDL